MSDELVPIEVICASCGADARADAAYCWMCGQPLAPQGASGPATPVPMRRRAAKDSSSAAVLTSIVAMAAVIVVLIGATQQLPATAVLFVIAVVIAIVATLGKAGRRKLQGRPLDQDEIKSTFLKSLAAAVGATIATIAALAIVAVVMLISAITALLKICVQ